MKSKHTIPANGVMLPAAGKILLTSCSISFFAEKRNKTFYVAKNVVSLLRF